MSFSLRTTILATGCILAIGTSAARAQTSSFYYYPAPGNYATTQGTVSIPAAGYYHYVPLYAGQAPASSAPAQAPASPAPAQGFTYPNAYYYPQGGASTEGGYEANGRGSAYVGGDEEDDPDW
jgi:hypothetical protein